MNEVVVVTLNFQQILLDFLVLWSHIFSWQLHQCWYQQESDLFVIEVLFGATKNSMNCLINLLLVLVPFINLASKLSNDPPWDSQQYIISKVLNNLNVSIQSHVDEIRFNFGNFEQYFKEIVDRGVRNKCLELVEYLIHSPEENFSVGRKLFNQVNSPLDEIPLFSLVNRLRCQLNNSRQN